jgi:hypothetical protein
MKIKAKKSVQKKSEGKKVRLNSIMRTRAFVYDLHAKCNSNSRIVLNEMVCYHKCGNNILAAMRDKFFQRIKVTIEDDRGFEWIGPEPTENLIQEIHVEISELQRKYLESYQSKKVPVKKSTTLEFVFDNEVPEMVPATVDADSENRVQEFSNQLTILMRKMLGL